jgi:LmbE family N-acetylglucosaminyl deacetylase
MSEATTQLQPMPDDWQKALVIVAHPDDIEYGAAAAVATWTVSGKEVAYVLVTKGEAGIGTMTPGEAGPAREAEQRASAALVGVQTVDFMSHKDGVIEYNLGLRRDMARAIRHHQPELVITLNHRDSWGPSSWNTPDHRNVGRAVLDGVGDAGSRWIFPELISAGADPWNGVRWVAIAGSPEPTHAVDVSAGLEAAVSSLAAHRLYLEALSDRPAEEQARD